MTNDSSSLCFYPDVAAAHPSCCCCCLAVKFVVARFSPYSKQTTVISRECDAIA
ncbi:hypothetical protein [Trichocoleus sp. FACHB-40]|uniref:hypothetical protein n=1 Tax=Trichocoleus sp. FACHB-40 TaxID=2692870 RepID=UPI001685AC06|nr:hypothetical protein [Trichocoleus sp. FACHB-40]